LINQQTTAAQTQAFCDSQLEVTPRHPRLAARKHGDRKTARTTSGFLLDCRFPAEFGGVDGCNSPLGGCIRIQLENDLEVLERRTECEVRTPQPFVKRTPDEKTIARRLRRDRSTAATSLSALCGGVRYIRAQRSSVLGSSVLGSGCGNATRHASSAARPSAGLRRVFSS
jgi:hypothetical protein